MKEATRFLRVLIVTIQTEISAKLLYRFAMILQLLFECISFSAMTYFWWKISKHSSNAIYKPLDIIYYFSLVFLHEFVLRSKLSLSISTDIKTGKLSGLLLKPYPTLLFFVSRFIGEMAVKCILALPLIALFLFIIKNHLTFSNTAHLPQYICSFLICALVSLNLLIFLGLLAFKMTETWGPELMATALYMAFGGSTYPLDLLPSSIFNILSWTPLFYMQGFSTLTILGRIPHEIWPFFALKGILMFALLSVINHFLWLRGLKKYEAIGI